MARGRVAYQATTTLPYTFEFGLERIRDGVEALLAGRERGDEQG